MWKQMQQQVEEVREHYPRPIARLCVALERAPGDGERARAHLLIAEITAAYLASLATSILQAAESPADAPLQDALQRIVCERQSPGFWPKFHLTTRQKSALSRASQHTSYGSWMELLRVALERLQEGRAALPEPVAELAGALVELCALNSPFSRLLYKHRDQRNKWAHTLADARGTEHALQVLQDGQRFWELMTQESHRQFFVKHPLCYWLDDAERRGHELEYICEYAHGAGHRAPLRFVAATGEVELTPYAPFVLLAPEPEGRCHALYLEPLLSLLPGGFYGKEPNPSRRLCLLEKCPHDRNNQRVSYPLYRTFEEGWSTGGKHCAKGDAPELPLKQQMQRLQRQYSALLGFCEDHTPLGVVPEALYRQAIACGADDAPGQAEPQREPRRPRGDWEALRDHCREASESHLQNIRGKRKYDPELYTHRRELEAAFEDFLYSSYSAFVLMGSSGMGKTNLLCHLFEELEHNPILFIDCNRIEQLDLELFLAQELGLSGPFEESCSYIQAQCELHHSRFVILFDAINEFRRAHAGPPELVRELDGLIAKNQSQGRDRIKFAITSRVKTWESIERSYNVSLSESCYFPCETRRVFSLHKFNEGERAEAFGLYQRRYGFRSPPYAGLPGVLKELLADPLMLRFASESFRDSTLPVMLDSHEVFEHYFNQMIQRGGASGENYEFAVTLAELMLSQMRDSLGFWRHKPSPSGPLARLPELVEQRAYRELCQRDLLIESRSEPGSLNEYVRIKFTYDRIFEYVLSRGVLMRQLEGELMALGGKSRWSKQCECIAQLIIRWIPHASTFNTLWGALQELLLSIHREALMRPEHQRQPLSQSESAQLWMRLAREQDVHILALLAAVSERMVMGSPELLQEIWQMLKEEASEPVALMLADASYRILTSDRFRLFYGEQRDSQQHYQSILYDVFHWGLRASPGSAQADASIQFLYFLWRCSIDQPGIWQYHREHAEKIIVSLLQRMGVLQEGRAARVGGKLKFFAGLLLQVGRWKAPGLFPKGKGSQAQQNAIENLVGVFMLLLAGHLESPKKIESMFELLKLILLDFETELKFLQRRFGLIVAKILEQVPYPINRTEFGKLFQLDERGRAELEDTFRLLDPLDTPAHGFGKARILELATSENSFVYTGLCYALGTQYHLHKEAHARWYLEVVEELFARGDSLSQYIAALVMYYINYFGDGQTAETMQMMKRFVAHILEVHKGFFQASEGSPRYTTNVIGTLGRSSYRYQATHPFEEEESREQEGVLFRGHLRFAVEALELAKAQRDPDFYLFVCKDIGLLGTLAPPRRALEVIRFILEDVEALRRPEDRRRSLSMAFSESETDAIFDATLRSLALIRVRYRKAVDEFLLEVSEQRALLDKVQQLTPEFRLGAYYSWVFEELFNKLFIYYQDRGSKILDVLRQSAGLENEEQALTYFSKTFLQMAREWAGESSPP